MKQVHDLSLGGRLFNIAHHNEMIDDVAWYCQRQELQIYELYTKGLRSWYPAFMDNTLPQRLQCIAT